MKQEQIYTINSLCPVPENQTINGKKILMLGGAYSQIPAIKYAKSVGAYVITCDYLPENPGHAFSDEYHNISTTDKEAVLELAKKLKIDAIVAYASDPSAPTSAFVSDALGLPGASYASVLTLAEKDRFRQFQKDHLFFCPDFFTVTSSDDTACENWFDFPVYVKPVDSSGSKGVTKAVCSEEMLPAIKSALGYSLSGRVIVEQIIESPYHQLHGDGFVSNNKLVFLGLGDQRFHINAPIGTSYPSVLSMDQIEKVKRIVSEHIEKSGFSCGAINAEVRIDPHGNIVVLEIGPRCGGNYVPQLMQMSTGFHMVSAIVDAAIGVVPDLSFSEDRYCFQYIIGSKVEGRFNSIRFSNEMAPKVKELYIHKKNAEPVGSYHNSSNVVGVAIMEFKNGDEMEEAIAHIKDHIRVILE